MAQPKLFDAPAPAAPEARARRVRTLVLARNGSTADRYAGEGLQTTARELLREGLLRCYGSPDRFVVTRAGEAELLRLDGP